MLKLKGLVCKGQNINSLGEFRDKGVGITGTSWRPKLPSECNYDKEFLDGNKRVANLIANKEMIKNGQGIMAIPVEEIGNYFAKLINYYETGDNTELKL